MASRLASGLFFTHPLIVGYWIIVKWWVDIIQNAARKKQGLSPKGKITCVCQDCGCVF